MFCNMQVSRVFKSLNCKKYLFVLALCACIPFAGKARAKDDAIWTKANNFYTQKQYDSAMHYYAELLKKYPGNASIQYNMGNACFRLNKVGAAILHFQKAAILEPGNKEITDNLLLAKGRVLNPVPESAPIFFVRWWNDFLHVFGTNVWAVFTLLVFVAVLALIWYGRVKKDKFAHAGRWLSLAIVCLIMCGCMTWLTHEAVAHSTLAVVLEPAVNLVDAPKQTGKVLGSIPEGTVIEAYTEKDGFVNVKLPNGREGWILLGAMEKV
jgi:tetratricopeptide (TPR) repeat protein